MKCMSCSDGEINEHGICPICGARHSHVMGGGIATMYAVTDSALPWRPFRILGKALGWSVAWLTVFLFVLMLSVLRMHWRYAWRVCWVKETKP